MIHGIGTDIVAVKRMADYWQRHGERGLEKMLALAERAPLPGDAFLTALVLGLEVACRLSAGCHVRRGFNSL